MGSNEEFFSIEKNNNALQYFLGKLAVLKTTNDFEKNRNDHIKLIINAMYKKPSEWSLNCSINISWVGGNFINSISVEASEHNKESIDDIYAYCFRFLFELYLSLRDNLSMDFERARNFAITNLDKFEDNAKNQIEYTIREMPISILKELINHENIINIKDFNTTTDKAKMLKEKWDEELEEKENKVTILKSNLDKYETAFNFVGLYQGFDELSVNKEKEKNNLLFYLRFFGVLIISPIVFELIFLYYNIEKVEQIKIGLIISIVPTVSLVLIFIYFFRILIHNYKSVKSQLLQLELRKTLCRFIQSYVNYSSEISNNDNSPLSKFENIVFSGIVSDDEKMPSTFDGIEQLSGLIKALKPK